MSSAITIGVVGAAVGGYSAYSSSQAAGDAASAQSRSSKKFAERLDISASDVEGYADEFVSTIEDLDQNFDPYQMDEAFNSLYEAVIMPMERDFDENVLPGIQAAYSGGILGQGAGLSGAAAESEGRARRDLAEASSQLRFGERDKAIARNYGEYDRRMDLASQKFRAQTAGPLMRAEQAPQIVEAQQNTIASQLAANQAQANILPNTLSSLQGGLAMGASLQDLMGRNT